MCQASCHFAAVEADAKSVTGSVAAWNNRTSSAYSDYGTLFRLSVRAVSSASIFKKQLKTYLFKQAYC